MNIYYEKKHRCTQEFSNGGVVNLDAGGDAAPALKKAAEQGWGLNIFFLPQKHLCPYKGRGYHLTWPTSLTIINQILHDLKKERHFQRHKYMEVQWNETEKTSTIFSVYKGTFWFFGMEFILPGH